jgi:hypothetical protein
MSIWGKLKTVKRKWMYLVVAIIVVGLAGGITAKALHERCEGKNGENKEITSYQTYYDLLYLENTTDLKISPEQAKALVPVVEKLSTATDKTTVTDLEKSIYKLLTPEQYYALLNGSNTNINEKGRGKSGQRKGGFEGGFMRGEGFDKGKGLEDTIKDVVLNMLKDKSSK